MNVLKHLSSCMLMMAIATIVTVSAVKAESDIVITDDLVAQADPIPPTICPPPILPPCPSCSGGPSTCGPITGTIITDGFVSQFVPVSPGNPNPSNCQRLFNVYVPDLYFSNPTMTFPIVYHLTGFGGNNTTYSATDAFVMDTMIAAGQAVPMIIVAPDPSIVNYQDSWYVNSILNGQFESYIIEELIPYVDKKYRQRTDASGNAAPFRAIMGQSMGGFGSLYYGIKYPTLFSAFSGDSATSFWVYNTNRASPPSLPEFPDGNPVYSYTVDLIQHVIDNGGVIDPSNVPPDDIFDFYSYAGAFSPITGSFNPPPPPIDRSIICSTTPSSCLSNPPFCVDLPILLLPMTPATPSNPVIVPTSTGPSFVENPPVRALWETFDPYNFLTNPAITNPNILKRQAIYLMWCRS